MNIASIRADWVGRVIDGKFTLLQWLGPSDSGGVFLAEVHGLPWKQAAVELIPVDAEDAETRTVAWELAAPLSHPHLIRLIASGRCQIDTSFLIYAVTEYPGEVLSEILPDRPLSPTEAGEMLAPVLDALAYLHGNGIVHGHLKPSNILVVEDQVKLSSRCLHVAGKPVWHTSAPNVYDAPETASEPISPPADVWSLGVTLVEAFTQYPVWDRSIEGEPAVPPSIPEPFHTIAQECLCSDPARRCTLSDIKAHLQPFAPASALPVSALTEPIFTEPILPEPISETPIAIPIPAKHRGPAILAAAFFLAAFAVTLLLRSHHVHPPPADAAHPSLPATTASRPRASVPANRSSKTHAPVPLDRSSQNAAPGAVANRAMPDLLPSAVQSIHGQVNVKVRVTVDPDGNVESTSFDSAGPSKYFAKMSLQAAQNWKFKPAQVSGKTVSSAWILHFKFTQSTTEITPVQISP